MSSFPPSPLQPPPQALNTSTGVLWLLVVLLALAIGVCVGVFADRTAESSRRVEGVDHGWNQPHKCCRQCTCSQMGGTGSTGDVGAVGALPE